MLLGWQEASGMKKSSPFRGQWYNGNLKTSEGTCKTDVNLVQILVAGRQRPLQDTPGADQHWDRMLLPRWGLHVQFSAEMRALSWMSILGSHFFVGSSEALFPWSGGWSYAPGPETPDPRRMWGKTESLPSQQPQKTLFADPGSKATACGGGAWAGRWGSVGQFSPSSAWLMTPHTQVHTHTYSDTYTLLGGNNTNLRQIRHTSFWCCCVLVVELDWGIGGGVLAQVVSGRCPPHTHITMWTWLQCQLPLGLPPIIRSVIPRDQLLPETERLKVCEGPAASLAWINVPGTFIPSSTPTASCACPENTNAEVTGGFTAQ